MDESGPITPPLQRIREVRLREEVTTRTMVRKLKLSAKEVRRLDKPTTDIRLSDLRLVAEAIGVPPSELICDTDHDDVERLRALLVRLAKITNTMLRKAKTPAEHRLAESFKAQLEEF